MPSYSIIDDESLGAGPRIVVIGVGGGGGNAVEHMVQQGIKGVTFVCANTDRQALDKLSVPNKLQLGSDGLGAGGNPEKGREIAESDDSELRRILEGYEMAFIAAGMGGGTGTGAAPVIARIAKDMGLLTVAVVTTPFKFEGGKRAKAAKDGIEQLSSHVDSIITVPNEKLQQVYRNMSIRDAFKKADDVLLHGVVGLVNMVKDSGIINVDFKDVGTALNSRGHAMMGIGRASGDDRARQAVEKAIRSPLLDDNLRLENAKGLLISITANDATMNEPDEVFEHLQTLVDTDNADIFYGLTLDESLGDEIQVTVIATGLVLDERPRVVQRPVGAQTSAQVAPQLNVAQSVQQSQEQAAPAVKPTTVDSYLSGSSPTVEDYLKKRQF